MPNDGPSREEWNEYKRSQERREDAQDKRIDGTDTKLWGVVAGLALMVISAIIAQFHPLPNTAAPGPAIVPIAAVHETPTPPPSTDGR